MRAQHFLRKARAAAFRTEIREIYHFVGQFVLMIKNCPLDSPISSLHSGPHMQAPFHLRCEYLDNPLGIDSPQPRLSWWNLDRRRGAKQSAYQIIAAGSSAKLKQNSAEFWDTGKVTSDQSIHVVYSGLPLQSRSRVFWKVRTWDEQGVASPWSKSAQWEMGLLDQKLWKGKWVGSPIVGGPHTPAPSPFLRKEFEIKRTPLAARLYVTALGLYEFNINGQRVGRDEFTPGRTEYARHLQYQTYDVTPLLRIGQNALGAILGDGWYVGHLFTAPRQTYGDRPRLLAQLIIDYPDGATQMIATDGSWKTASGPILAGDFLMGETYDARLELPGWSNPGFNESTWVACKVFEDPGAQLVANRCPPVRAIQEILPVRAPWKLFHFWFFDLGQNMVGRLRLKLRGKAGQTIVLRFAEMLNEDGGLYTESLRGAKSTDYYTLKGDREEIWEPRFTFHGFRYVQVSGLPTDVTPALDTVTGIVLHQDIEPIGTFKCSSPLINQLQHNIVWGQKGNFLEIPTDCPQRDERLGWTGDAQVFIRTAAFNMNVAGFFTRWLRDMEDSQRADGAIPSVVPDCPPIPADGGPAWADAAVICPWTIYLCYGDTSILRNSYPMMTRFMDFLQKNSKKLIRADEHWAWRGYGDWLANKAETPRDLIGTAFFAHCADLMSRIATVLKKSDDARKYRKLFEKVRLAWQNHYITPDGLIIGQTQTAYVLALQFNLLPKSLRKQTVAALVRDIEDREMHLSTGFVGTPYLPHVLSDAGRTDIAYALLNQTTCPSWLYPVTQGATTIWERWDGWTKEKGFNDPGMNSFNHYAYGAVGAWMYNTVAGLEIDPASPGYKHAIVRPQPGGGLTSASASLNSMYGKIEIAWQIKGELFHLNLSIPANTTATVYWPGKNIGKIRELKQPRGASRAAIHPGPIFDLLSGQYSFAGPRK